MNKECILDVLVVKGLIPVNVTCYKPYFIISLMVEIFYLDPWG